MTAMLRLGALGLMGTAVLLGLFSGRDAILGDVLRKFAVETERERALEASYTSVRRSINGKQVVIAELTAGRLSFAEAASRFQQLQPEFDPRLGGTPSPLSRAQAYQGVLDWVRSSLYREPQKRAELLPRLERERARLEAEESPARATPQPQ
jgi:hypothetical protein